MRYAAYTQAMRGATYELVEEATSLEAAQELADSAGERWRANGFVFALDAEEALPEWLPSSTGRTPVYRSPVVYHHR